jgi:hypothetical protein
VPGGEAGAEGAVEDGGAPDAAQHRLLAPVRAPGGGGGRGPSVMALKPGGGGHCNAISRTHWITGG